MLFNTGPDHLKRTYGLSVHQFAEMKSNQADKCAICDQVPGSDALDETPFWHALRAWDGPGMDPFGKMTTEWMEDGPPCR